MKVPTPDGVYLQRLITTCDVERYRTSTDSERLEVRAYLRYVVRVSTPGNARATVSVLAGFLTLAVTLLIFVAGLGVGDPDVLVSSVTYLMVCVMVLLLVAVLVFITAGREDNRNAMASSWLAEIEAAEAILMGTSATREASASPPPHLRGADVGRAAPPDPAHLPA